MFYNWSSGAGKTLAGLNIANERHNFAEEEHAVFLSGNKPLVDVLREALIRDESSRKIFLSKRRQKRCYLYSNDSSFS